MTSYIGETCPSPSPEDTFCTGQGDQQGGGDLNCQADLGAPVWKELGDVNAYGVYQKRAVLTGLVSKYVGCPS